MSHVHSHEHAMDMAGGMMDMSSTGDMGNSTMHMGGMMMMYMHFSTSESSVLFKSWDLSGSSYGGFCFALIVVCFLKEFLFAWRTHRLGKSSPTDPSLLPESTKPYASIQTRRPPPTLTARLASTVLYTINLFFGYMIMLVLMSYNWGFLFSILAGSMLGHFIANWVLSPNTNAEVEAECCEK